MTPVALALDLGTSYLKAAAMNSEGKLGCFTSRPSPNLREEGLVCETDAAEYLNACRELLRQMSHHLPKQIPLGIACQRSSFLLWDANTGKPETPLISWRDRRGELWCQNHVGETASIQKITGLPLSPHYVGPKLASLLAQDPTRKTRLAQGDLKMGTLETFILWSLTAGRCYESDITMTSRTLMVDIRSGRWSQPLADLFGVDIGTLPKIVPTSDRRTQLDASFITTCTVADQAACSLAALGMDTDQVLVNLGTGIFVLRPTGRKCLSLPNYCTSVLYQSRESEIFYGLEGTINGIGPVSGPDFEIPVELPGTDPTPNAFCIPDSAGLGSPHWRPELSYVLSDTLARTDSKTINRVRWEGAVFRIREILEDFLRDKPTDKIVLSGGLRGISTLARWLASCLGREIFVMELPEQTLLGAASLAASSSSGTEPKLAMHNPEPRSRYLRDKYQHWKVWGFERINRL